MRGVRRDTNVSHTTLNTNTHSQKKQYIKQAHTCWVHRRWGSWACCQTAQQIFCPGRHIHCTASAKSATRAGFRRETKLIRTETNTLMSKNYKMRFFPGRWYERPIGPSQNWPKERKENEKIYLKFLGSGCIERRGTRGLLWLELCTRKTHTRLIYWEELG